MCVRTSEEESVYTKIRMAGWNSRIVVDGIHCLAQASFVVVRIKDISYFMQRGKTASTFHNHHHCRGNRLSIEPNTEIVSVVGRSDRCEKGTRVRWW